MGQLLQLNLSFQPAEDRLLLKIKAGKDKGTQEFQFWLTRRFVSLLLDSLDQLFKEAVSSNPFISPEGREAFIKFQQEAAISQSDFSTPFSSENADTPLGASPLLLVGYRTTKTASGAYSLLLQASGGASLTLNVNTELLISLSKLLFDEAARAEWELRPSHPNQAASFPGDAPKMLS